MDGRKGVWSGGMKGGVMFKGEEGAEAVGERCVFRAEGVAEGRDWVVGCGLWWGLKSGLCFCNRGCAG